MTKKIQTINSNLGRTPLPELETPPLLEDLYILDAGWLVTISALKCNEFTKPSDITYAVKDTLSELLNQLPIDKPTQHNFIVACDHKIKLDRQNRQDRNKLGYYNHLRADGYKGSRPKNPLRNKCAKAVAKLPYSVNIPGFEADQVAGIVCQHAKQFRDIKLLTADSDWYQLHSVEVTVVDLYHSRWLHHHTKETILEYYQDKVPKRSDFILKQVSDILEFKRLFGDRSDNYGPQSNPALYTL
jgi:hypothetical protein